MNGLVFDVETTGLDPAKGHRIIQIGALIVTSRGDIIPGADFTSYVNPEGKRSDYESWQVHRISDEDLTQAPLFAKVFADLEAFARTHDAQFLIGHNVIPFDLVFVAAEAARASVENFLAKLPHPPEDTLELAMAAWPGKQNTLDAIAKRLNVDRGGRVSRHDALEDVCLLANCLGPLREAAALTRDARESSRQVVKVELRDPPADLIELARTTPLLFCRSSYSDAQSILTPKSIAKYAAAEGRGFALADTCLAGGFDLGKIAHDKKTPLTVPAALASVFAFDDLEFALFLANEAGWPNLCRIASRYGLKGQIDSLTSIDGLIPVLMSTSPRVLKWLAGAEDAVIAALNPRYLALIPTPAVEQFPILAAQAACTGLECVAAPIVAAPAMTREQAFASISALSNANPDHRLLPWPDAKSLAALYAEVPYALDGARRLIAECGYLPSGAKPRLPRFHDVPDEPEALAKGARDGLAKRLADIPNADPVAYSDRLEYEIGLITKLGFSGYFLMVADFIAASKRAGIPVGPGRGSGAGSLVAWAMTITDVDPIRFALYFERFINPDRVSLPDFDIDFCESRRAEAVIYVANKYGADHVAQIGAWTTMKAKAAFKAAARATGVDPQEANRITKDFPDNTKLTVAEAFASEHKLADQATRNPAVAEARDLAAHLESLPAHRTRHPSGILITDDPLETQTPLIANPDTPGGVSTTQFEMKAIEAQGLVKFDFLGLKTLTVIARAAEILASLGTPLDPWAICKAENYADPAVYQLICMGWTRHVFQLGQPGMTRAITQIQPTDIEDLIALVSLYRPGPMDQIPLYAARKQGLAKVDYDHPALAPFLAKTFGIAVYQEQVMEIAKTLAGYSLGEADLLRRAMGKKIPAEMAAHKTKFIDGCVDNTTLSPPIDAEHAAAIFEKIAKFALYGFNRSHAAAYSIITYVTAWLKKGHTEAFLAAAMDQEIGDVKALRVTATELERLRIPMLPVDVNASTAHFEVEPIVDSQGKSRLAIRWPIPALAHIGQAPTATILSARAQHPFSSSADFAHRMKRAIGDAEARVIIASGALDSLAPNPVGAGRLLPLYAAAAFRDQAATLFAPKKAASKRAAAPSLPGLALPEPEQDIAEPPAKIDISECISAQEKAYGFSLFSNPIDAFRDKFLTDRTPGLKRLTLKDAIAASLTAPVQTIAEIVSLKQEGDRLSAIAVDGPLEAKIIFKKGFYPDIPRNAQRPVAIISLAQRPPDRRNAALVADTLTLPKDKF